MILYSICVKTLHVHATVSDVQATLHCHVCYPRQRWLTGSGASTVHKNTHTLRITLGSNRPSTESKYMGFPGFEGIIALLHVPNTVCNCVCAQNF